jgi:hypothetical protein
VSTLRLVSAGAVPAEPRPWFETIAPTPLEHRAALERQRTRLLALAVGEHLPHELRLRVEALDAQLADA